MKTALSTVIFFLALSSTAVFGASAEKMNSMTKEQRENMASLHDKMGTCLRSEDKTVEQCHDEMKQSCKDMGETGCPMMGTMDKMKLKSKKMMNKAKDKMD